MDLYLKHKQMQVVKTQLRENLYAALYLSKMFHSSITIIVPMSCQDNKILTLGNLSCLYPYLPPPLLSSGLADWCFAS